MTTQKRAEQLVRELAGISTLCELIKIYYYNSIKGTRFKNPRIQDKAEKIKSFAESIQKKELGGYIEVKKDFKETMENEQSLHLWRIFNHLVFCETSKLEKIADDIEKL